MELIDRYLFAVGKRLEGKRREDILAELRENLMSQVEDREGELGRPLTIDEEEEIVRKHGHPMVVAARYLPQQYLIGPAVFPYYWYVLRTAFPWVALIYTIAHCAEFLFHPMTLEAVIGILFGFIPVAFYFLAWVTGVFAVMEYGTSRYVKNINVLYAWSPRKLPAIEIEPPRARGQSKNPVLSFLGSVFTLVYLILVRKYPVLLVGGGVAIFDAIRPAAVWNTVWEIAIAFVTVQLAFKFSAILSPAARSVRGWFDVLTKAGAAAILGYLTAHGRDYVVLGPKGDISKLGATLATLNNTLYYCFQFLLLITIAQLMWEIWKLVSPRTHTTNDAAHLSC